MGDIAGEFVAPRAEDVDRAGATLADGEVCYAPGMSEALERLGQADLMGITLPRRYGGLNFPVTVSVMIVEMISRADAALMNVFGLQDIAETVNKFACEELKQAYLPRFASGEVTGSMALTEPEAGSDLQNIQLKATLGADGVWRLIGVKRFITNGCGQVSLVLARCEEGTTDARGLSMFLYERDEHMKIRRLEDKLGIHGSPTCELQFDEAPALLVGERRRGLTTYVMSLMNGARLAIAAQAQGIAEAAYRAASKYADERVQFGGPIRNLTAVAAMLADMKVALEASRALLYETAMIVDLKEGLERRIEQLQSGERAAAARRRAQGAARRAQERTTASPPCSRRSPRPAPPRWPTASPTTRCRSTAARATCATSPSSVTRATRASPTSTKAPRSCRSWPPSAACCRAPWRRDSTSTTAATSAATPELLAQVRAARERWVAAVAHVREARRHGLQRLSRPPPGRGGHRPHLRLSAAARRPARRPQAARGALLRRADERARRGRGAGGARRARRLRSTRCRRWGATERLSRRCTALAIRVAQSDVRQSRPPPTWTGSLEVVNPTHRVRLRGALLVGRLGEPKRQVK